MYIHPPLNTSHSSINVDPCSSETQSPGSIRDCSNDSFSIFESLFGTSLVIKALEFTKLLASIESVLTITLGLPTLILLKLISQLFLDINSKKLASESVHTGYDPNGDPKAKSHCLVLSLRSI